MRTSATGADRPRSQAGFTLVEMMVVMVIVGLMASVAILTIPRGPSLSAEADQFAARLARAKEEAVITNRTVGVRVDRDGYAFRVRTPEGWQDLSEAPFKAAAWGGDVAAVVGADEPSGQVVFESTGVAEPLTVVLRRREEQRRISIDAAGNVRVDAAA